MRLHRDAKLALLRSIPLFADCNGEELTEVAAIADEIDLPAGKQVVTENADGREFVVVIDGSATVSTGGSVVASVGAGEWFGEVSLVTGAPRNASVVAKTALHALVIEGHRFTQLLEHAPSIAEKVQKALDRH
ncbi:MAG TPA: cyclic nucleotide-binding domain-containing protein, partial [Marmoricola sp.]|nr:cyclic nucleotide-binding domain-containing protein [Marmoricola sp.]